MTKFEILDIISSDGFQHIKLLDGPFKDLQFFYRGVRFEVEGDCCFMKFDYEIESDHVISPLQKIELNDILGKILHNLIEKSIEEGSTVFYGGR